MERYSLLLDEIERVLEKYQPEEPIRFLRWYLSENGEDLQRTFGRSVVVQTSLNRDARESHVGLDMLPFEILEQIIDYCSVEDLICLTHVNRALHCFINQEIHWKRRCNQTVTAGMGKYPLWKVKCIEQYTNVSYIHYTFLYPHYILGTIEKIYDRLPQEGTSEMGFIVIRLDKHLFSPKSNRFTWKERISVPLTNANDMQRYYAEFREGRQHVFALAELSNISVTGRRELESIFTPPVLEIAHVEEYTRATEIKMSAYYSYQYTQMLIHIASLRSRCEDKWIQEVKIIHRDSGLGPRTFICKNCSSTIKDICYHNGHEGDGICCECKIILLGAQEITEQQFNIPQEPFPELPYSALTKIATSVSEFMKKQLLSIFNKVDMNLQVQRNIIKSNTTLRVYSYAIEYACTSEDLIDKTKKSALVIYLYPDGIVKSCIIIGDIRKECCHPAGKLYDSSPAIDNSDICKDEVELYFYTASEADVVIQGSSCSFAGEWTTYYTYNCGNKSYRIEKIGNRAPVILGILNNWNHQNSKIPDYEIYSRTKFVDPI